MKLLIADTFEDIGRRRLADSKCDVVYEPSLTGDSLLEALRQHRADILIVRSTPVTAEAIDANGDLKLIVRAGAGYDTIDVVHASERAIYVANCPGKNAIAVAELAWGLILSCDRRLPDQTVELRQHRWNKAEYGRSRGLFGASLGILGLGTIGREVARRGKAFGMTVNAWSRSLSPARAEKLGVRFAKEPLDVARAADVVSIHVAAVGDTEHLVDEAFLAAMRDHATLINTSRGSVIDEQALANAIRDKQLRVGLDVFANEPKTSKGEFESLLVGLPGVYGTHHIGASTSQAQNAIALEAVRIVEQFLATGEVLHCVNRAARRSATCMLTVRHLNRPGVLAHVFRSLSEARINVEEMENVLYDGQKAACARIQLSRRPDAAQIDDLRQSVSDILSLDCSEF